MDEQSGRTGHPVQTAVVRPPQPEWPAAGQDQRLQTIFELAKILVSETEQETMLARFLHGLIDWLDAAGQGVSVQRRAGGRRISPTGHSTRWTATMPSAHPGAGARMPPAGVAPPPRM
jgi:hypothetical protein